MKNISLIKNIVLVSLFLTLNANRVNATSLFAFSTEMTYMEKADSSENAGADSIYYVQEALKGVDLNGACSFNFQNLSGKKVKLYIDGEYVGKVGKKDHLTIALQNGIRQIYCIANDGTVWDEKVVCNNFTNYNIYRE